MKTIRSNKEGFTLIEMLLVISIVGLTSVIAVSSYLSYKKGALLEFAGDNIVSQFYEMRSKTVYGEGTGNRLALIKDTLDSNSDVVTEAEAELEDLKDEAISKCYGFYYSEADGLNFFEKDFVSKKVWEKDMGWKYDGCEVFDSNSDELQSLKYDDNVRVVEVILESVADGVITVDDLTTAAFWFVFTPPEGEVYVLDSNSNQKTKVGGDFKLKLKIQYGGSASKRFQRWIELDLFNQTASVKKVS